MRQTLFGVLLILGTLCADQPVKTAWAAQLTYDYKRTNKVVTLVEDASALIEKKGEEVFPAFRKHGSKWYQGDSYLFIYDLKGVNVVHPVQSELEGKNLISFKDINGKPVIKMIIDTVTKTREHRGWVHYMWIRPEEIFPLWKSAYVRKVISPSGNQYAIGSGIYNLKIEKEFIVEMVDSAVELLKKEGKAAFDQFRNKASPFDFMDSYIFVIDEKGMAVVDPGFPSLEQRNLLNNKDAAGRYIVREMIHKLERSGDTTWISYMWPKPGKVKPSKKLAYIRKVKLSKETFIVGAGYSPARPIWMR
ncbi:MAG: cache domain-containing protein [Nitrospirota bacterium]|jgi:signal transduction histidine kinase|nr:cache domain-containing protein [Nitrospirota bacterium]